MSVRVLVLWGTAPPRQTEIPKVVAHSVAFLRAQASRRAHQNLVFHSSRCPGCAMGGYKSIAVRSGPQNHPPTQPYVQAIKAALYLYTLLASPPITDHGPYG